jgi:hypothetical protein
MPEYNKAPWHPVILCDDRLVAMWEAGWSGDGAWVWSNENARAVGGWLLTRWNGLEIDYGHVVRGMTLPDGAHAGFYRAHEIDPLLRGAVWWSTRPLPQWWAAHGVIVAFDDFSRESVMRTERYVADDRDPWGKKGITDKVCERHRTLTAPRPGGSDA